MLTAPTLPNIQAAHARIAPHIFRTPLRASFLLSQRAHAQVFLKLENWQITGSFKPRGALNKMAILRAGMKPAPAIAERARGVVTASAGNHALGVALAARVFAISPTVIFLPRTAPQAKVAKLREYPVEIRAVGDSYADAHHAAEQFARETGATFIHAYDDPLTVAGQGTIALEILENLPDVDAMLIPVGGGGMIAGMAIAAKAIAPQCKIIGVQPAASPALRDSLRDGKCYEEYAAAPTICDGLAGGIGQICFEVAQKFVDDVIIVEEAETRAAIRALAETEQMIVEGSGAVGIAALIAGKINLQGKRVAVVLSGGNVDVGLLNSILTDAA
ncbi:MAG: threonine/serine dehydratase [Chloroflexi bacterium]|nr:threonine/serine dehydratase [Chloroflexota bacterium]